MTREQLFERVREIMVELFELEPEQVQLEASVFDDLDLDSIDAIDLVAKLQQLTGQRIEEEQMRGVRRVADIVDLLANQLADRAS
ncbi:acyl carrier protein [Pseudenhygromyxa sp. WMMC2535]|uniref:acyl carrier protein n=1 Tax=Pseudenhygromyxa sp. WMMC2535 TaxID=2712867 RepID=UPI001557F8FE|nr:acyl carrier protein [Pseudenhygromyxa sp. WMMC2535]